MCSSLCVCVCVLLCHTHWINVSQQYIRELHVWRVFCVPVRFHDTRDARAWRVLVCACLYYKLLLLLPFIYMAYMHGMRVGFCTMCVRCTHTQYCACTVRVIARVSPPVALCLLCMCVCGIWWLPRVDVGCVFDITRMMVCGTN